MLFKKEKKTASEQQQNQVNLNQILIAFFNLIKKAGTEYEQITKNLECTFDTTYIDDKGKKSTVSETKNCLTWIPKILIDINNSLKEINRNLEGINESMKKR